MSEIFRKIIAFILIIFISISLFPLSAAAEYENLYALTGIVVEIDKEIDLVTIQDYNGNLWRFYSTEDWAIYDFCSCIMFTNNTEIIYDDIIISTFYSGRF